MKIRWWQETLDMISKQKSLRKTLRSDRKQRKMRYGEDWCLRQLKLREWKKESNNKGKCCWILYKYRYKSVEGWRDVIQLKNLWQKRMQIKSWRKCRPSSLWKLFHINPISTLSVMTYILSFRSKSWIWAIITKLSVWPSISTTTTTYTPLRPSSPQKGQTIL